MRPENSPSLSQTSAESPTPKPRLSSARVAPNPSQTTPSNPRNFFQASDPGASLGADIPFVRLCSSEGVGRSQRCPEVGERDQSVSTGFFFAPLPAFLTARTGVTPSAALLALFLILQAFLPFLFKCVHPSSKDQKCTFSELPKSIPTGRLAPPSLRCMWLGGGPEMKERMKLPSLPALLQTSVQGQHDFNTLKKSY